MTRLEKIEQEAQRARERIAAMQALLKDIEGKRTEQENLQIVQQIRALKLTKAELYAFLSGGELPGILAGAATYGDNGGAAEPETAYTRKSKRGKAQNAQGGEPAEGGDTANLHDGGEPETNGETQEYNQYGGNAETNNFESEGNSHEEN